MGITLHQAQSLAWLAEKHGSITQVSFQRRGCPMVVKLRDECMKRGPIVHAVCRFYKCDIKPYTQARDHMMDDGYLPDEHLFNANKCANIGSHWWSCPKSGWQEKSG